MNLRLSSQKFDTQNVTHQTVIGIYTIVAPDTIRSHQKFPVSVTLHDAPRTVALDISVTGPSYNQSKIVNLSSMESKQIDFDVPALCDGSYQLTSKGIEGLQIEKSTALYMDTNQPNIYIQTDKAVYKPGDLVQYRILILDENIRPVQLERPLRVAIKDAANNYIKEIKVSHLTKGVYSGRFQLTEQPILGQWTIEVDLAKDAQQEKNFKVIKYVLPRFSVDIETVKDLAITENSLKVAVCAKYTYGKPVKGKAIISILYLNLEKIIDINGKEEVEFALHKGLNWKSLGENMTISAIVDEELTGNRQSNTIDIKLHTSQYVIKMLDSVIEFEINEPFAVKAAVEYLNGDPVRNAKDPIFLKYYRGWGEPEESQIFESTLDDNGVGMFKVNLPNGGIYLGELKFMDKVEILPCIMAKSHNTTLAQAEVREELTLIVNTERPRIGDDASVTVKAPNMMTHLTYVIVGRGCILRTAYITLPEPANSYEINFKVTFEMIPRADVFVFYVDKSDFKYQEISIDFELEFQNSIKVRGPRQAKPGQEVSLDIETVSNSFVGLLGVDQRTLLLERGNDFERDTILNNLRHHNTNIGFFPYPGKMSGLAVQTNARFPYEELDRHCILYSQCVQCQAALPAQEVFVQRIRKNFDEVWLFEDIDNNDNTTNMTVTKCIPDSMTSWIISAFAINANTGFTMTENPLQIKVFQPFFIDVNLPYSVKRHEVIEIPVAIFNYLDNALEAQIVMENTDGEYEFADVSKEIEKSSLITQRRAKKVMVSPNSSENLSFVIRPQVIGDIMLKIEAITSLASDAIHKKLKVEAEGVTQYKNQALFLNLEKPQKASLEVAIPTEAVKDSEYVEFSVVGDLLGPTLKNLNELVRKPYGCGEQNMVNFVPNILVLHYLEAMQIDLPSVTSKAKNFLEIGYQRELTYKHKNGAYSAFGEDKSTPNTWLTAYVARSFIQATKYTTIDENVIQQAFDFLIANQEKSGQFKQTGHLFSPTHQNDVGFNAYVLLAFLQSEKYAELYRKQIEKCLEYVVSQVENEKDSYALSIVAIALHQANHKAAGGVLEKLQAQAKEENGFKWWTSANHNDIEITAYALQTLVDTESINQILPIIKWLIGQRNSNGGFDSTQDTVVGLEALIKFSKKFSITGNSKMSITFKAFDDGEKELSQHRFEVNKDNSLVLQTHVLPKSTRLVSLEADGLGSSLIQLSYRYNLATKDDTPSFKLDIKPKTLPSQQLQIEVCASYEPHASDKTSQSNMAVMEVALPSGYIADKEKFDDILAVERVERVDTENCDTKVIVYFNGLVEGEKKRFNIIADRAFAVDKQKPVPIILYDYYNSEHRGTEYYQIKSPSLDICEES
uniref:TEP1-F n=1 Tax=Glossina austeni TaxID=7395 RepID=A0A1A9VUV4_GLOAU